MGPIPEGNLLFVSADVITTIPDGRLNELMRRLLIAQAHFCGSAINELNVNTNPHAADEGCDGWTARPMRQDPWLGDCVTCWQFKAGTQGEPEKIRKEVLKRIPSETLKNGGRFVVVTPASNSGKSGMERRRDVLVEEANAAGIPSEKIVVLTSENLYTWCNQYPAIAAFVKSQPPGLETLEQWSQQPVHNVPWQAVGEMQREIEAQRRNLATPDPVIYHLHIEGQPGVGKTRFALELCRDAEWRDSVIYVSQAMDVALRGLIQQASQMPDVRLVLVADEVQESQLVSCRNALDAGSGRVRLITIGHCPSPDSVRIPSVKVPALPDASMEMVVKGWYAGMPPEHVDFIVRFSGGYVRLAQLATEAVAKSPDIDTRRLLQERDVGLFLRKMLGGKSHRELYVVAALQAVGWEAELSVEGEAIARHLGLEWNHVRHEVHQLHREFGIAPKGGRYRYISPTPLGNYLAADLWENFSNEMRSLPAALPSESARRAYFDRIRSIASSPTASKFGREELQNFFRVGDFLDANAVRRWSAFSAATPQLAASNIEKALSDATIEERAAISGGARRHLVSTLVGLAWRSACFHDATRSLALLAEAENETWANNATHEFVARFEIRLGGTSVPYRNRLSVLDELLSESRELLTPIIVKALSLAGNTSHSRWGGVPASDDLPEKEWDPKDGSEHVECIQIAIGRLVSIAKSGDGDVQAPLLEAIGEMHWWLGNRALRGDLLTLMEEVRTRFPDSRELIRKMIADYLQNQKNYWHELRDEDIDEIQRIHNLFEDKSLEGRIQQYVGQWSAENVDPHMIESLASDVVQSPRVLEEQWGWLTSSRAANSFLFGMAVARADADSIFESKIAQMKVGGNDNRFTCGYVSAMREAKGDGWYNAWYISQAERKPRPIGMLVEIAWRCGATGEISRALTDMLHNGEIAPDLAEQLQWGKWTDALSVTDLRCLLDAMITSRCAETAIAILWHRVERGLDAPDVWTGLAASLVANTSLIASGANRMAGYYWEQFARRLVDQQPKAVAAAILEAHASGNKEGWFARHSRAGNFLSECARRDPGGFWDSIQPYLEDPDEALVFCIGLPKNLLADVPFPTLKAWIDQDREIRAPIIAKLVLHNFSSDDTIASRLVENYGDDERVLSAIFSDYCSGVWAGKSSTIWEGRAKGYEEIAKRTNLPNLRRWATEAALALHEMANRFRQREDEEGLRD